MKLLQEYKELKNNISDEDEFYDTSSDLIRETLDADDIRALLELCLKLKGAVEFSEEYFDRNSSTGGTSSDEFIHWSVCNEVLKEFIVTSP